MNKQQGFSLIELLVVLGIIAVLTGLAAFNFNQARMRARDVQRKNDMKQLQQSLELYKNDNSSTYPADDGDPTAPKAPSLYPPSGTYLKSWPLDPKNVQSSGSWTEYTYRQTGGGTGYTLTACLENAADDVVAGALTCHSTGKVYTVTNP